MSSRLLTASLCSETGSTADSVIEKWGTPADQVDDAGSLRKRRSVIGRCLVRCILETSTGTAGAEWLFTEDHRGKPYASHRSGNPGPAISISHSKNLIAAASGMAAIGIDVEHHRLNRPLVEMARFGFGPREQVEIEHTPAKFYRTWTLREAMAKATGEGITQAIDGMDRIDAVPEIGAWTAARGADNWLLAHLEPTPGYSLALAAVPLQSTDIPSWSLKSIAWISHGDQDQFSGIE